MVYYDIDPAELNPHIFNVSDGRPIYDDFTDGAFLVREAVENYVARSIEAGKPAYLNAVVLAADEYDSPGTQGNNKRVCAVCRVPGWDVIPAPMGQKNCIPTQPGLIYGPNSDTSRAAYDSIVDFNTIFNHTVYFPTTDSGITLSDLLPEGYDNFEEGTGTLYAKIVKVTYSDFANKSRPEIIGKTGETIPFAVKTVSGVLRTVGERAGSAPYSIPPPTEDVGRAVPVETLPDLPVNVVQGRAFPPGNKSTRNREVDTIIIHESVAPSENPDGGRRKTYGVLNRRGLSIHYMVGKDGSVTQHEDPETTVTWHGGGGEGEGINGRSIGIEILNAVEERFKDIGPGDKERVIGDYINPPMITHENTYRLTLALVKQFPKLELKFHAVRGNNYYWRFVPGKAKGIVNHGSYVSFKYDGSSTGLYMVLRSRGYSEDESYAYLKQALTQNEGTIKSGYFVLPPQKQQQFPTDPIPEI